MARGELHKLKIYISNSDVKAEYVKRHFYRVLAFMLALVFVFNTTAMAVSVADISDEYAILTQTLREPDGVRVSDAILNHDPEEIIEVAVQFVTPPSVALRLLDEGSGVRARSEHVYDQQALEAHTAFRTQLEGLIEEPPPGEMRTFAVPFEIFSEHHSLFNGVFMRVPQHIAMQIAELPEVYAVTLNQRFYTTAYHENSDMMNQSDVYRIIQTAPDMSLDSDEPENEFEETADETDNEFETTAVEPENEFEETADEPDNEFETTSDVTPSSVLGPLDDRFVRESRVLFNVNHIHNNMGFTGAGVRVAVLDTGIDHGHREFARVLNNQGRIRGQNFTDSVHGLMDIQGHGTHVSGIVVAMAPNVELWHYKVLDDYGGGFWHWILSGLEQARRDRMHVVNLSFGVKDPEPFSLMDQVVNLLVMDGITAVIAAGNSGQGGRPFTVAPPSLAGLAIAVAGGTAGGQNSFDDAVSFISSRGPVIGTWHIKPDITAPGERIFSAIPVNGYEPRSGTSMAAPHIAGIAALLIQQNPRAAPSEIKARLMNTARPLANYPADVFSSGAGFVDPIAALNSHTISRTFATARHVIPWDVSGISRMETMASLSFGVINRNVPAGRNVTIPVTIHNRNTTAQTYSISAEFSSTQTPRPNLAIQGSVRVNPNSSATVNATIQVSGNTAPELHYGFVNINLGGSRVARLPFAVMVNHSWLDPTPTNPFTDVPNHPNWRNNPVSWANRNGITQGTTPTTFEPNAPVTRAQFVTFFHRVYGSPTRPAANFSDMPGNQDFRNAISWAVAEGITRGTTATTFSPGRSISREELATMLYRRIATGPAPYTLGRFTDRGDISEFAREAVNWAAFHGIMGDGMTVLTPRGNATRAETVAMLYRVVYTFDIPAP